MSAAGPTEPGSTAPPRTAPGQIAIDYTAGPGHAPGVGRYVRELVRALVRLEDSGACHLELLEYGRAPRPMEGAPLGLSGDVHSTDRPDPRASFSRRRVRLPRRAIAQAGRLPRLARLLLGPRPGTQLLHRTVPKWPPVTGLPYSLAVAEFPRPESRAHGALADACRRAQGVLVFSTDAAERAVAQLGVAAGKVHLSPVGSEHWERDRIAASQGAVMGQPAEGPPASQPHPPPRSSRDILVLGAIRSSRQPLRMLAGFEALAARGCEARLLLVGRPGDASDAFRAALARLRAENGAATVRWIEDPVEARLPECVAGSTALLHLSEDEASPVTPLEAARMGLALVTSPLPAFHEALGVRAAYVNATDAAEVADALEEALRLGADPAERARQRALAAPFTWAAAARAHRDAWNRMLTDL